MPLDCQITYYCNMRLLALVLATPPCCWSSHPVLVAASSLAFVWMPGVVRAGQVLPVALVAVCKNYIKHILLNSHIYATPPVRLA